MALNLPAATLIGYSSRGDFFGEDIARWRTIQTVTIEGVMSPTQISNMLSSGSNLPTSANAYLGHSISINGISTNNSKLISLEFPASDSSIAEMHDDMAKYIAVYEIYTAVSSSSFWGISFNDLKSLEDFTEDISFELADDNSYSVSWSMNVKYASGASGGANGGTGESANGIAAAKALWSAVTSATPTGIPTSMLGNGIDIWAKTDSGGNALGWAETEVYDTQNFNCSFSRTRNLLSNNDNNDYTSRIKNSLTFGEDGGIVVSEEVEVVGLKISGSYTSASAAMDAAKAGAAALLGGSYARCNTLYGSYKNVLGTETLSLVNQYINKTVSYDEQGASTTYSIDYANDEAFDTTNKYIFNSSITRELAPGEAGSAYKFTEEGTIKSFCRGAEDTYSGTGMSCEDLNDALSNKLASSATRVSNVMIDSTGMVATSTKYNYKTMIGKEASFTKEFSTDISYRTFSSTKIKKINKSFETSAGVVKKEWYNPPNNPLGGEFFHVGQEIVEPSTRKITYEGTIERNKTVADTNYPAGDQYRAAAYIQSARSEIQNLALYMKADALNVYTEYLYPIESMYLNKYYYSSFDWSFTSDYKFTATLEMKYIVPLGPRPIYPELHSDTTQITV
jgi:hypothetical protein